MKPLLTTGNITYLIETANQKYILRICPEGPRFRSKQEIAGELELIDYLLKNKFPAPIPIADKKGERIIEWKGNYGYIKKYDNGITILDPNSEQVKMFGRTIGWLHHLISGFKTKNKREHIFDLAETKKNFSSNKKIILRSNFKNKEQFIEKIKDELFRLDFPDDLPKGMIHEDLGKRHVLWQGKEISYILDFDRCYYGKIILDLGQACRGWCFVNDWKNWSNENFESLISGYQNKRRLTDIEKKYCFPAIKFAVLERSIAFALRFILATNDSEDEKFAYQSVFDIMKLLNINKDQINQILKL